MPMDLFRFRAWIYTGCMVCLLCPFPAASPPPGQSGVGNREKKRDLEKELGRLEMPPPWIGRSTTSLRTQTRSPVAV